MALLRTLLLSFMALAAFATAARADAVCEVPEAKACDVRKYSWCGPVDINFWVSEQGARHCERAIITLTPTDVLPNLRRIRCYFFGQDTELHFGADNYRAISGPSPGDRIFVRNGVSETVIHGHYTVKSEGSHIFFENVGPGDYVVIKCNGYGPA